MELKTYIGIIFINRERIGTKSEGPEYYINLEEPNDFGQTSLFIRKEVQLWQEDSNLHQFVGKRVLLKGEPIYTKHVKFEGTIKSEGIIYKEIKLLNE